MGCPTPLCVSHGEKIKKIESKRHGLFPLSGASFARDLRVQSTIDLMEEAAPTFENSALLRNTLLEVKQLFECIDDLLQVCLPKAQQYRQQRGARLRFKKQENLQTLKDFTGRLDRIVGIFLGPLQSPAYQHSNRLEDALLAIQLTRQAGTYPSLERAKHLVKGEVIDELLVELRTSLGRGSFGVVMAGTYCGHPVAIKRALFGALTAKDKEIFR